MAQFQMKGSVPKRALTPGTFMYLLVVSTECDCERVCENRGDITMEGGRGGGGGRGEAGAKQKAKRQGCGHKNTWVPDRDATDTVQRHSLECRHDLRQVVQVHTLATNACWGLSLVEGGSGGKGNWCCVGLEPKKCMFNTRQAQDTQPGHVTHPYHTLCHPT